MLAAKKSGPRIIGKSEGVSMQRRFRRSIFRVPFLMPSMLLKTTGKAPHAQRAGNPARTTRSPNPKRVSTHSSHSQANAGGLAAITSAQDSSCRDNWLEVINTDSHYKRP